MKFQFFYSLKCILVLHNVYLAQLFLQILEIRNHNIHNCLSVSKCSKLDVLKYADFRNDHLLFVEMKWPFASFPNWLDSIVDRCHNIAGCNHKIESSSYLKLALFDSMM